MRHMSHAMRSELFKYRKRRSLSLDGRPPGATGGRYIAGLRPATLGGRQAPPVHHDLYDPRAAFYQHPEPGYEPTESWVDSVPSSTPPLRFEPTQPEPVVRPVRYEDSLMSQRLLEAAMPIQPIEMEALPLESAIGGTPAFTVDSDCDAAASQWASLEAAEGPSQDPLPGSVDLTQGMFEQAMAEASQMTDPGTGMDPTDAFGSMNALYEQQLEQGLEGIVQDAMPQEDPFEMQRRMYDQQMQMMDPFAAFAPGMMGPGCGPMGPMPGP